MRKIISGRRSQSRGPFQMEIDTTKSGPKTSASNQFVFPIFDGTDYFGYVINFQIDWGDGTTSDVDSTNYLTACTHTYSSSGVYTVSAEGNIAGFNFWGLSYSGGVAGRGDAAKVIKILQWGDLNITGGANVNSVIGRGQVFRGCTNLTAIEATDTPTFNFKPGQVADSFGQVIYGTYGFLTECSKLERINKLADWNVGMSKNLHGFFNGCQNLLYGDMATGGMDFTNWNVSNVNTFYTMFRNVTKANFKIWSSFGTGTTVSSINCFAMFDGAANFNNASSSSIDNWGSDFGKVTNCSSMFKGAKLFNRDISGWDTSNVTNMNQMFSATVAVQPTIFNQPIGAWDTSSVIDMRGMFTAADSFDQNLSNWDVSAWSQGTFGFPPLTQSTGNFKLSTANYNALLIAWDTYTYPSWPGVRVVDFGDSQYSLTSPGNSVVNARNSLITKWGAINDGGGV